MQCLTAFKVAVVYCLPGQTNLQKSIFKNKPPENSSFWVFLDGIARKITLDGWKDYRGDFGRVETCKTYFSDWKNLKIMFHVCPYMNKEQRRRLIGNDICFIVFYDGDGTFNPNPIMDDVGGVPQIFAVVQPCSNDAQNYHLSFFNRYQIKPYEPNSPPVGHIFDIPSLKEYLFTKLHNGLVTALQCPPLNKLYSLPRKAQLLELLRNIGLAVIKSTTKEKDKDKLNNDKLDKS